MTTEKTKSIAREAEKQINPDLQWCVKRKKDLAIIVLAIEKAQLEAIKVLQPNRDTERLDWLEKHRFMTSDGCGTQDCSIRLFKREIRGSIREAIDAARSKHTP